MLRAIYQKINENETKSSKERLLAQNFINLIIHPNVTNCFTDNNWRMNVIMERKMRKKLQNELNYINQKAKILKKVLGREKNEKREKLFEVQGNGS